jgi:hypothetical protein
MALTIFSLPRELRDDIWSLIIDPDIHLLFDQGTDTSESLKTPNQSKLTIFSLLVVSKAVKAEVTCSFRRRHTFAFRSSSVLLRLLKLGISGCGRGRHPDYDFYCPRLFFKMAHLSILPQRRVYASNSFRHHRHTPIWLATGGQKRILSCNAAHRFGWTTADSRMADLLSFIHNSPMRLRSLVIPAILLINVHVVRQLRKLRRVHVHFAFVPENTTGGGTVAQKLEWLGETADTDIILPIYEAQLHTEPMSVVSLSYLAAAIHREVMGGDPIPARPHGVPAVECDPPLWIDMSRDNQMRVASPLELPSSGWYRYSARDPGVACLEKAQAPTTPELEPPKRKVMKRLRQEMGRRCAGEGPFHLARDKERWAKVDNFRCWWIRKMGLRGVVMKGYRNRYYKEFSDRLVVFPPSMHIQ